MWACVRLNYRCLELCSNRATAVCYATRRLPNDERFVIHLAYSSNYHIPGRRRVDLPEPRPEALLGISLHFHDTTDRDASAHQVDILLPS